MAHKSTNELKKELDELEIRIKVGDTFSHFKHPENHYKILAVGFIESTEELSIIYQAEYGDKFIWIRTVPEFFSKKKLENGEEVDRFKKVE